MLILLVFESLVVNDAWAVTGDLNNDGRVNAVDLQLEVNVILGTETDAATISRADLNGDGATNAVDLQRVVNIILSVPLITLTASNMSSAPPGTIISLTAGGLGSASDISVRFSNQRGYLVELPIVAISEDNSVVDVGVPILFDTATGAIISGVTNVEIVAATAQGFTTSNSFVFTIADLPPSAFPPGTVVDALLNDAMQLAVKAQDDLTALRTITGGAIAEPDLEDAIPQILAGLQDLKVKVNQVLSGQVTSVSIGRLPNGDPLVLDNASLSLFDRLILSGMRSQTLAAASSATTAAPATEPRTILKDLEEQARDTASSLKATVAMVGVGTTALGALLALTVGAITAPGVALVTVTLMTSAVLAAIVPQAIVVAEFSSQLCETEQISSVQRLTDLYTTETLPAAGGALARALGLGLGGLPNFVAVTAGLLNNAGTILERLMTNFNNLSSTQLQQLQARTCRPATFVGSLSGTDTFVQVFPDHTCTWTDFYTGTISVTIHVANNSVVSGTAHVLGQVSTDEGTPASRCTSSSDTFDDTGPVSGSTSQMSWTTTFFGTVGDGNFTTGTFTGSLSGTNITGVIDLRSGGPSASGSGSIPVTLTRQ